MQRRLLIALALLLLLPLAGGSYFYWQAKRAEPSYSGTLQLSGLTAPVTVRYGTHAVPTIEAASLADLLFAQGYIVASERMWQMDLMRRLATGRLAEGLGAQLLPADRFFRTVGLHMAAQRSLAALDDADRDHLAAYAAGVNAYVTVAADRLPLEYHIAGFVPVTWTPEDSLVIAEYLGWVLSFNVREELVFLNTAARVGSERAVELFPVDEGVAPSSVPTPLSDSHGTAPTIDPLVALIRRLGLPTPGAASNAWVINGHRTPDARAFWQVTRTWHPRCPASGTNWSSCHPHSMPRA